MRIGSIYPQTAIGADAGEIRAYAEGVAGLGFDHVLIYDHVLGADPESHPEYPGPWSFTWIDSVHEPMVVFGYLAAVAPSLELVTGVVISPQRQTALVAKQASMLDILTRGRFRLGIGQGWNPVEYEALGVDFKSRGARMEEQVALLRRLWQEPLVTFTGDFDRVTAAGLNPLPLQQPIPIWIGGSSERALRRIARVADGFFPQRPLDDDWPGTLERMREWRAETDPDAPPLGIEARVNVAAGTPDDWHAEVERWRSLGATHVSLGTASSDSGIDGVEAHLARLAEARDAIAR